MSISTLEENNNRVSIETNTESFISEQDKRLQRRKRHRHHHKNDQNNQNQESEELKNNNNSSQNKNESQKDNDSENGMHEQVKNNSNKNNLTDKRKTDYNSINNSTDDIKSDSNSVNKNKKQNNSDSNDNHSSADFRSSDECDLGDSNHKPSSRKHNSEARPNSAASETNENGSNNKESESSQNSAHIKTNSRQIYVQIEIEEEEEASDDSSDAQKRGNRLIKGEKSNEESEKENKKEKSEEDASDGNQLGAKLKSMVKKMVKSEDEASEKNESEKSKERKNQNETSDKNEGEEQRKSEDEASDKNENESEKSKESKNQNEKEINIEDESSDKNEKYSKPGLTEKIEDATKEAEDKSASDDASKPSNGEDACENDMRGITNEKADKSEVQTIESSVTKDEVSERFRSETDDRENSGRSKEAGISEQQAASGADEAERRSKDEDASMSDRGRRRSGEESLDAVQASERESALRNGDYSALRDEEEDEASGANYTSENIIRFEVKGTDAAYSVLEEEEESGAQHENQAADSFGVPIASRRNDAEIAESTSSTSLLCTSSAREASVRYASVETQMAPFSRQRQKGTTNVMTMVPIGECDVMPLEPGLVTASEPVFASPPFHASSPPRSPTLTLHSKVELSIPPRSSICGEEEIETSAVSEAQQGAKRGGDSSNEYACSQEYEVTRKETGSHGRERVVIKCGDPHKKRRRRRHHSSREEDVKETPKPRTASDSYTTESAASNTNNTDPSNANNDTKNSRTPKHVSSSQRCLIQPLDQVVGRFLQAPQVHGTRGSLTPTPSPAPFFILRADLTYDEQRPPFATMSRISQVSPLNRPLSSSHTSRTASRRPVSHVHGVPQTTRTVRYVTDFSPVNATPAAKTPKVTSKAGGGDGSKRAAAVTPKPDEGDLYDSYLSAIEIRPKNRQKKQENGSPENVVKVPSPITPTVQSASPKKNVRWIK